MKPLLLSFAFLAALTVTNAQSPLAPDSMETQIAGQLAKRSSDERQLTLQPAKPNEIKSGRVSYDGIAVQLVKTDNPLQMVNPNAPAKYGSPEQNVARDPINGKVTGLKLLAVNF